MTNPRSIWYNDTAAQSGDAQSDVDFLCEPLPSSCILRPHVVDGDAVEHIDDEANNKRRDIECNSPLLLPVSPSLGGINMGFDSSTVHIELSDCVLQTPSDY